MNYLKDILLQHASDTVILKFNEGLEIGNGWEQINNINKIIKDTNYICVSLTIDDDLFSGAVFNKKDNGRIVFIRSLKTNDNYSIMHIDGMGFTAMRYTKNGYITCETISYH